MRYHHFHRNDRPGDRNGRNERAHEEATLSEAVPQAEAADYEPHLLLTGQSQEPKEGEASYPVLIEVPDGEENERDHDCGRMKLVHRAPLHRRVQQSGERRIDGCAFRSEVLARQPEDRQRSVGLSGFPRSPRGVIPSTCRFLSNA
jgi:hypothetical protein